MCDTIFVKVRAKLNFLSLAEWLLSSRQSAVCRARVLLGKISLDRERENINLENAKVRAMRVFLRQLSVGFLAGLFRTVRGYARREQEKREKKADHREVRGKKYVGGAISSLEDEETSNKL